MTLSLVDPTTAPSTRRNADGDVRGSDYAALSRRVRQAGLFEPTPGFYIGLSTVLLGLFVAGWTAFALLGDSWYQLLVAAGLAIVGAQIAFLGHDIAHRQVFRSRRAAERAGALGSLLIGLTYGWWQDKHTRHHANPNHLDHDPDVGLGVIAWTPEQAEAHRGLGRFLVRWQAYLFFPLLLLEGIHLHISSARAVITDRGIPHRRLEGFFLAVYALVHVGLPFLVLSPLKAVLFVVVLQGVFGLYLGCSFAPNHKGMPLLQPGEKLDYLRRQVLTARNVYGGPLAGCALRRPELPDRASSIPQRAAGTAAAAASDRQGVLRRARRRLPRDRVDRLLSRGADPPPPRGRAAARRR